MKSNSSAVRFGAIFTKRRLGLAGLAGVAACAACCSVPLLVAAGVGGGALAALAALVKPGAELFAGLGAASLVLGMAVVKGRQSSPASCGCGPTPGDETAVYRSPAPAADEPIVCTADFADKPTVQAQIDGYRAAFAHLARTERFEGGFRWVFRKEPGLSERLKELAQNENQCCKFFRFEIRETNDHLLWETRADDAASRVLVFFSQLPERLQEEPRRGADTAALKRGALSAGLAFAADEEKWQ